MKQNIDRRDFLKTAGSAALVMGGLGAVTGCGSKKGQTTNEELGGGEMTYRTNAVRGDKVSLLGYGCMRWPTSGCRARWSLTHRNTSSSREW